jgi:tetratricopeptide (TPR) repeat protein
MAIPEKLKYFLKKKSFVFFMGAFFLLSGISVAILHKAIYAMALQKKGDQKYNSQQYKEAIEIYSQGIKIQPDWGALYRDRGYAYAYAENLDYKNAIKDYDRVVEMGVANSLVYGQRGYNRSKMNDYGGALKDYNLAIKLEGNNPWLYKLRAVAHYNLGNKRESLNDYSKSIELDSDDPDTYYWRGDLRSSFNDTKGAISDFEKALLLYQQSKNPEYIEYTVGRIKGLKSPHRVQ